ncbi:uncharacterized protein E0L32_011058 [Thyridium curvatum]|uniref:Uncharacterized protein n=1 Tax=Thyridium curvatum TaxID=1093900 RepID=A0A507AS16_9PEZI|nr:uncharacterized protein E0L32_011058 [Thyridium curvatum]TPX06990.1 hypothetical protein E0L32_011058 [Thyridium curvatum]
MGSSAAFDQDELTVLITGFGPFKENYPRNPSWEIVSRLPDYIPPLRAKLASNPTTPHATIARAAGEHIPPVRLLVHPEPVRVSYAVVRPLVPRLWAGQGTAPELLSSPSSSRLPDADGGEHDGEEDPNSNSNNNNTNKNDAHNDGGRDRRPPQQPARRIDLCVHVGMAGARMQYSLERRGHRDGYRMKDVDGALLDDERFRHPKEDGGDDPRWEWFGVPEELETDVDADDVLKRWRAHAPPTADVRISEDAGHYLCDFIYFSSLAHLWKAGEHRRVVFLHVPSACSDDLIASGREILLSLIRSIVESEISKDRAVAETVGQTVGAQSETR